MEILSHFKYALPCFLLSAPELSPGACPRQWLWGSMQRHGGSSTAQTYWCGTSPFRISRYCSQNEPKTRTPLALCTHTHTPPRAYRHLRHPSHIILCATENVFCKTAGSLYNHTIFWLLNPEEFRAAQWPSSILQDNTAAQYERRLFCFIQCVLQPNYWINTFLISTYRIGLTYTSYLTSKQSFSTQLVKLIFYFFPRGS